MAESRTEHIAVIGLGYVGLPVALAFARRFPTIGFDLRQRRIDDLAAGRDATGETSAEELAGSGLRYTARSEELAGTTFFVVAVPTPIDKNNRPDLSPLIRASETVG